MNPFVQTLDVFCSQYFNISVMSPSRVQPASLQPCKQCRKWMNEWIFACTDLLHVSDCVCADCSSCYHTRPHTLHFAICMIARVCKKSPGTFHYFYYYKTEDVSIHFVAPRLSSVYIPVVLWLQSCRPLLSPLARLPPVVSVGLSGYSCTQRVHGWSNALRCRAFMCPPEQSFLHHRAFFQDASNTETVLISCLSGCNCADMLLRLLFICQIN